MLIEPALALPTKAICNYSDDRRFIVNKAHYFMENEAYFA